MPRAVVVVVSRREQVIDYLEERARRSPALELRWAVQEEQRGTGHALLVALPEVDAGGDPDEILVLCGDAPLVRPSTLSTLLAVHRARGAAATVLTAELDDPTGYGRVVRGPGGDLERIVEDRDATPSELAIREINSAEYVFDARAVREALAGVGTANRQGEYYLTDTIAILRERGRTVAAWKAGDAREVLGVNTVEQLAEAESAYRGLAGAATGAPPGAPDASRA